ncbi:hypothetical protein ACMT1E_07090 [Sphingomonas flavalba]|uniref:hypothetical protein n=1 Tax=Sphingomonas flavalba TaxID=2559804 RepID=UPI0039E16953
MALVLETAIAEQLARLGPEQPSRLTGAVRAMSADLARDDIRPTLGQMVASGALFRFGTIYGLPEQRAAFITSQRRLLQEARAKSRQTPDGSVRLQRAWAALEDFAARSV